MSTIVVSNISTGFETDRPAYLISNDAFPLISNAYIFRGRVWKKRGVSQLGRLTRKLTAQSLGSTSGTGTFSGNIVSILSLETNASLVLNTSATTFVTITVGADIFTDTLPSSGVLTGSTGGSGTLNYSTGALTLTGAPINTAITITFSYYPDLPVMGIELFNRNFNVPGNVNFPVTVFFDTRYSYLFTDPSGPFYDVNFYVGSGAHFVWSGADYQQFWTTNYQGAMWATNNVPGLNFKNLTNTLAGAKSILQTAATTVTVGLTAHGLSNGDLVFINQVSGTIATAGAAANQIINLQTGVVTVIDANSFTLTVSGANFQAGAVGTGGIAQYLTNTIAGQDGIKYFIGDPTGDLTKGWVNFAPPLSSSANPQYLLGAKIIIPFKNRLLFFGTWTATSATAASPVYNPNQMVACQNGTVFYANGGLPPNQTSDATSFYQNVVGKGLRLNAPISQEIIVVNVNKDIIIVIFENQPLKLYSTGDDSAPFLYQSISSEFGGQSTFSGIPLDVGVLCVGPYGYTITSEVGSQRTDLQIPDQVFNINQLQHGANRVTAIRDFRNEFVYFTFPTNANASTNSDQIAWNFPTTTLAYNYRENCWSTFIENYTTYGSYRATTNLTWSQLGNKYGTWSNWHDHWNLGSSSAAYPSVLAGNQQGFIMQKNESTNEGLSQYIKNIVGLTITSPDHCLNDGDYITIQGALGTTNVNNIIFQISATLGNKDTFTLLLTPTQALTPPSGTYGGGATYNRLTNIDIMTKQFPVMWQGARQTKLGTQRYLFDTTPAGEVSVSLLVNQDNNLAANDPISSSYIPQSDIVITYAEPTDLNVIQKNQDQIWHRINTCVIGDTVQLEFFLSDTQMRDALINQEEIVLHAFTINVAPGPPLAI